MHADFQPTLFAHGRLLWRCDGSDATRFSPRSAWHMVQHACEAGAGEAALWDPFCGTGLIPAVARLFFHRQLQSIRASDLHEPAVRMAERNLGLVSDPQVAAARRREVAGRMGQNPKSAKRWGEVRDYLDQLEPLIVEAAASPLPCQATHAAAAEAGELPGPIFIVGDAPYGKQSALTGPPLPQVVQGWIQHPEVAYIDLMCTSEQARDLATHLDLRVTPARGGRARVRYDR